MNNKSNVFCSLCANPSDLCFCDPTRHRPEKITIISDGRYYMLKNEKGEFWMGAKLGVFKAPEEPGADVPCWFTREKSSAEAQAALLMLDATWELPVFESEIQKAIKFHLSNQNDPYNIDNTAICILRTILNAHRKQRMA